MKRWRLAVAMAAVLTSAGVGLAATVRIVATNGTDSENCGASNSPCDTIQWAIDHSSDGDTVRVRNGTYNECIFVELLDGGAVTVETEAFFQSQTLNAATIDGVNVCDVGSAPNNGPVVIIAGKSVIRGFKIQHGGDSGLWAFGTPAITHNTITLNSTPTIAGGIFAYMGSYVLDPAAKLEIDTNTIVSNTAQHDAGGIFVIATAIDGTSNVEIHNNIVRTNTAGPDTRATAPATFGGGITVLTDTALDTDHVNVAITKNTIEGNVLNNPSVSGAGSYGGGIFVATGVYYGYGTESVQIGTAADPNTIRNNSTGGYGGGVSVNLQPGVGGHHEIVVDENNVSTNTAGRGGGGIHAFFLTRDSGSPGTGAMSIEDNTITGNHSNSLPPSGNLGGGGLFAEMYSLRTSSDRASFQIRGNDIQLNDSKSLGGGVSMFAYAQDDDPDIDTQFFAGDAIIEFENNLVAQNDAVNPQGGGARGGGVWAAGRAFGQQATASIQQHFNTVVQNETDAGSAGGFEWEAYPELNTGDTLGNVAIALTNSIIANNEGFAAGGPVAPGGTVTIDVNHNDAFQNGGANANWEANLGVTTGTNGNISVDPELDAFFTPQLCSPTVDAGDPAIPVLGDGDPETDDAEPQPNGGRVNMGALGASSDATRTLPDSNGDGTVDGIDILRLAVAFGATDADPAPSRFDPTVDFDADGDNDGDDLSYLAALYARSCS